MSATISPERAIHETFAACRAEGRAALVVYTTAGHPSPDEGLDALLALADAGTDILELGVPFSDPLADGPTIQLSSFRAIEQGVDLRWTLDLLARFRELRPTPVVIFSYLNPLLHYGIGKFLEDASAAGANGVLVTDLPLGGDEELERLFLDSPLDLIRLVAPTTTIDRVGRIAGDASGFLYFVSRTGVTGAREELAAGLADEVAAVRAVTDLPVAVGFGISTPEQARTVAALADGVVVGSAVVARLAGEGIDAASDFVRELRAVMATS